MVAAEKLRRVSVDDYLAGELSSPVKHEYLGGFVHAMAGASNNHNIIAGNVFAYLHSRLRGQKCRPYNSDTKIRINQPSQVRFYYPDASVVCDANPREDSYQESPLVLVEVLSAATRRTDMGEKLDAYTGIATLLVYLLVEQDSPAVTVFRRRSAEFESEVVAGTDATIPLSEIGIELPLREIYEDVTFEPESDKSADVGQ